MTPASLFIEVIQSSSGDLDMSSKANEFGNILGVVMLSSFSIE